ncbi:hypothetical protein EVAR_93007_1 [Eumeta japonica]|uniref:Uncharacterized protein n=1 Tax=Eumeta variegata TaxID=151549 RepID=A0A4C1TDP8_EUMVA|nr:hypothetical protein EVAR_93007_1 [Eumeta japonica]
MNSVTQASSASNAASPAWHAQSHSAAYKHKSGSEKRKKKRKIELQTAAANPKRSGLSFTSTPQKFEDPQNRSETQPD